MLCHIAIVIGIFDLSSFGLLVYISLAAKMPFPGLEYKRKRTAFTSHMILELEKEFLLNQYLNVGRKRDIALRLKLPEQQIKIWFQNRRQKWKKSQEQRKAGMEGIGQNTDPSSAVNQSPHHHQLHQRFSLSHLHASSTHQQNQFLSQLQNQQKQLIHPSPNKQAMSSQQSPTQQDQSVRDHSQTQKHLSEPHQPWGGGPASAYSNVGNRMFPPGLVPISPPYSQRAGQNQTHSQSPYGLDDDDDDDVESQSEPSPRGQCHTSGFDSLMQ